MARVVANQRKRAEEPGGDVDSPEEGLAGGKNRNFDKKHLQTPRTGAALNNSHGLHHHQIQEGYPP